MNGETKSAITIFQANKGIDTGDIFGQQEFSLAGTMNEIFKRIIAAGFKETIRLLDTLSNNFLIPVPQDNTKATIFKRRRRNESELTSKDFKTKSAQELYNFIRSLTDPYPNAFIRCKDGKKLFFTDVKIDEN